MTRAYGKLILLGEHAVVYGKPAIAVPLGAVYVDVDAEANTAGSGITVSAPNWAQPNLPLAEISNMPAITKPIELALRHLDIETSPDVNLHIRSTIPIASGFGSGAALASALIQSMIDFLGQSISKDALNHLVYEVEKIHHGTPSGIDNSVIVYEQPIYFVRDQILQPFSVGRDFHLLVAHVGHATPTYETVSDVRKLYEAKPERIGLILDHIGQIVEDARALLERGEHNGLGAMMNQNHEWLRQLTVSDESLDHLCQVARENGAWGAKLSGGGRGGNLIALISPEQIGQCESALRDAGATQVLHTTIKAQPPTD